MKTVKVQQVGINTLSVSIPKEFEKSLGLIKGDRMKVMLSPAGVLMYEKVTDTKQDEASVKAVGTLIAPETVNSPIQATTPPLAV